MSWLAGTEGKGGVIPIVIFLPRGYVLCISHSQYFVTCSRVIKLCVAVTCRPNIVFYSDQSVYKIGLTLKALIQILKFYNTKPTDATNIFGTRSTHTQ
jgi:hypothetical protein